MKFEFHNMFLNLQDLYNEELILTPLRFGIFWVTASLLHDSLHEFSLKIINYFLGFLAIKALFDLSFCKAEDHLIGKQWISIPNRIWEYYA